jgi:hypothetical protein
MAQIKRNCDNCKESYLTDTRNLSRGWGKCCSKSCAASLREKSRSGYNPERVKRNNIRRVLWNDPEFMPLGVKMDRNFRRFGVDAPNVIGGSGVISRITTEGYRVMDGIAYDEFDDPVYHDDGLGGYDEGDSEYWNNSDNGHER